VSVCGTVTTRLPASFSGLVRLEPCVWVAPPARGPIGGWRPRPFHAATPTRRARLVPASLALHRRAVVSDYQPILHRLRLDAYGLGPTNPTRMFLPSETLGLRRTRFSRALSLLIPAFALRIAPAALPGPPSPRPNAPLPRAPAGLLLGASHPRCRCEA
jgi:hypothetical protein